MTFAGMAIILSKTNMDNHSRMQEIVYLNGKFIPPQQAFVSPLDRGFLFGDGVYEVMKARNGKVLFYDYHTDRLRNSLAGLKIEFSAFARLKEIFSHLLAVNQLVQRKAFIYLQVTRGTYPQRTHEFPSLPQQPTVFVLAFKGPADYLREVRLISRVDERWQLCHLKTTNLLANVLAKQEAIEADAQEVVLVRDGVVVECSSSALAMIKNGTVYFHPPASYMLPSITMRICKELCAAEDIELKNRTFTLQEAYQADELMVLSTVRDISAAVKLDNRTIGKGSSGPITQRLMKALEERLAT